MIQCNIRDIRIRKQIVDDLRRAKEEAEQSNEAKTRFISMLSHGLRTPLNPLMMIIHAWKTENILPPSLLADLEIVKRCVEIETKLIDDLLDVTAITLGKINLELRHQDINELLQYTIEAVQPQIDERKIRIVMSLDAKNTMVRTDFARLAQVVWNVTGNAVKFTPVGGTVTISTANEDSKIRIVTGDTGICIPREALGVVFDAFELGTLGELHGAGGLGLGLTIAKRLIEFLGGSISVQSDGVGKGTRFTIMLESFEPQ